MESQHKYKKPHTDGTLPFEKAVQIRQRVVDCHFHAHQKQTLEDAVKLQLVVYVLLLDPLVRRNVDRFAGHDELYKRFDALVLFMSGRWV